jgi:hypothetical protein
MKVIVALLAPMVVGLVIPFLLALAGSRWRRTGIGFGCIGLLVIVLILSGGGSFGQAMSLLVYLTSLALFFAGLFEGLTTLRLPRLGAQLICSLLISLMIASLFISDVFLQASSRPQDLVPIFAAISPMVPAGDAVGVMDVGRLDAMYGISSLADFGTLSGSWVVASIWLALIGGLLLALSQASRIIRSRGSGPLQPTDSLQADR